MVAPRAALLNGYTTVILTISICSFFPNCYVVRGAKRVLFCYYASWDQYKEGDQKFLPQNIDPYLCSHIVYAFASLDDKFTITDPEFNHKVLYQDLVLLKKRNRNLKLLLAIGGWNFNQTIFSRLVGAKAATGLKAQFIQHSIAYLRENGFDGLNIDWEYPGTADRGGDAFHDKYNFVQFLKETRDLYSKEARSEKQARLMLTINAGVSEDLIRTGYNVELLSKYVDYIMLLTYTYNGCWNADGKVGYSSPLHKNFNSPDSVEATIQRWIRNGASPRKLMVGIPTFGTQYQLQKPCDGKKLFCGAGLNFSHCSEQITSTQICQKLYHSEQPWDQGYDKMAEIAFAHTHTPEPQWISFENKKSVFAKIQLIWTENLGGAYVWLLSGDDHSGNYCSEKEPDLHVSALSYPITRTLSTALKINQINII